MALLEEGMSDEVDIDFVDADIMDVRNDDNEEENRSFADTDTDAVADAAAVAPGATSADTDAAEATAKFFSFCFDTRK